MPQESKTCPRCRITALGSENIESIFGYRNMGNGVIRAQSYCRACRIATRAEQRIAEQRIAEQRIAEQRIADVQLNDIVAAARVETGEPRTSGPVGIGREARLTEIQRLSAEMGISAVEISRRQYQSTRGPAARALQPAPATPPQQLNIPLSTNPLIFNRLFKIGVELEGGWQREIPFHCEHTEHDVNCSTIRCSHRHSPEERNCGHTMCCNSCTHHHTDTAAVAGCYGLCTHVHDDTTCPRTCNHICNNRRYYYESGNPCQGGYHMDGSVRGNRGNQGECASKPYDNMADFTQYVERYHPDSVNESCGTHFHISLKTDLDYELLASKEFYRFFLARVNQWIATNVTSATIRERIGKRLSGACHYACPMYVRCAAHHMVHEPSKQRALRSKDTQRYAHLNYCETLSKRRFGKGTIECRLWHGMKTPALIVSAAECLIRAAEDFLEDCHTNHPDWVAAAQQIQLTNV